ncbi:helix-turn-helix domain-containing protein, partial [Streptomyces nanhaiensis]|uniref:helix-turn-helix domain-containing protein n=1 Tax=Streptomyces nanhaiensis TaxID=679319 RepID=UPI00399D1CA4
MGAARGTEEFASFLRELKERSGHSYGTLARRLHTSTSTLHRYCNGRAVPAQYAPVERLARLCGATPQELLELHRRWMRADALRGSEPERPGPAAEAACETRFEPEPEPEPEPAPEPESAPSAAAVPRRSRVPPRRRPTVIALLAVLLAAAVAAATYALPDPQRRTAGGPAAPVPGADGGSGVPPSSSRPSSVSPSAPASSPDPAEAGTGGNTKGGARP